MVFENVLWQTGNKGKTLTELFQCQPYLDYICNDGLATGTVIILQDQIARCDTGGGFC